MRCQLPSGDGQNDEQADREDKTNHTNAVSGPGWTTDQRFISILSVHITLFAAIYDTDDVARLEGYDEAFEDGHVAHDVSPHGRQVGRAVLHTGAEGLYRSDDGGRSWLATAYTGSVVALAASLDGRTVILVDRATEVRRSNDGGVTWPGPGR